jgi:hypothetical protein
VQISDIDGTADKKQTPMTFVQEPPESAFSKKTWRHCGRWNPDKSRAKTGCRRLKRKREATAQWMVYPV